MVLRTFDQDYSEGNRLIRWKVVRMFPCSLCMNTTKSWRQRAGTNPGSQMPLKQKEASFRYWGRSRIIWKVDLAPCRTCVSPHQPSILEYCGTSIDVNSAPEHKVLYYEVSLLVTVHEECFERVLPLPEDQIPGVRTKIHEGSDYEHCQGYYL